MTPDGWEDALLILDAVGRGASCLLPPGDSAVVTRDHRSGPAGWKPALLAAKMAAAAD